MDKMEGKKEGSSNKAINKERVRQGYKSLISKTPMKFSDMSKDRKYHIKSVEKARTKALSAKMK